MILMILLQDLSVFTPKNKWGKNSPDFEMIIINSMKT